jgi:hypothetical protein
MKKVILISLLSIFVLTGINAQITGGGTNTQTQPNVQKKGKKGVFGNHFYITLAYASAKGDFGTSINRDVRQTQNFGYGGMGKGTSFKIGSLFYFNNLDFTQLGLPEGFRLGLDANYFGVSVCYSLDPWDLDPFDDATIFFNTKIGPTLSYNVIDRLVVDFRFTFQPTFVVYSNIERINDLVDSYGYYHESSFGTAFKLRKGLGLYARYKPIIFGFELSWGKLQFKDFNYRLFSGYDCNSYGCDAETTMYYSETILKSTRLDIVFGFAF